MGRGGHNALDLSGQRFGKLVALERVSSEKQGTIWRCDCDCGKTHDVLIGGLRSGRVISCGCSRRQSAIDLHKANRVDLSGTSQGLLRYVAEAGYPNNRRMIECQCACGNNKYVTDAAKYMSGHRKDCGCLSRKYRAEKLIKNLTGEVFGRLTVLRRDLGALNGPGKSSRWICLCQCGIEKSILGQSLTRGATISCGCYIRENNSQIQKANYEKRLKISNQGNL